MDKAIIFGVFDFVNFHVCKTLLDKGIEVNGIHIEEKEKIEFLDEKRLEIGRNANFLEHSLLEWENIREEDKDLKTTLIFSIYDLYMLKKEEILQNETITKPILQYIERNKNNTDIVFILPIQMLTGTLKEKELKGFLGNMKGFEENARLFYLPSTYGPWQSPGFLFQQAIFSELHKTDIKYEEREWINDALYVDDAMESLFEIIETGKSGRYLLESGRRNHWLSCAAYLNVAIEQVRLNQLELIPRDNQLVSISVKRVTPIAESLTRQIDHVQRLYGKGAELRKSE